MDNFETPERQFLIADLPILPEVFEKHKYFLRGAPFQKVAAFFEQLFSAFGLDLQFLENPEQQREFSTKLLHHMSRVDESIGKIRRLKKKFAIPEEAFCSGWENRYRLAQYLAFFIHYGEKRKSGEDYIAHPYRVAVSDGSEKCGLLDEDTLIAETLHDVIENLFKGLLKLGGISDDKKAEAVTELKKFIKEEFGPTALLLVEILTKERIPGQPLNRHRTLLTFFIRLADEMQKGNFDAAKAVIAKGADRLDNSDTLDQHAEHKRDEIWTETAHIFLPLFRRLKMRNAEDWLRDFLYFMDSAHRKKLNTYRSKARSKLNLITNFEKTFHQKMQELLPQIDTRIDYVLIARPRGFRHIDAERQKAIEAQGRTADASSASAAHQRGFHHYFIFVPIKKESAGAIAHSAKKVFSELFPLKGGSYPEENELFGQLFSYRTDIGSEATDRKKYGAGVYRVFLSPRQAREQLFGYIHTARLEEVGRHRRTVMYLFRKIGKEAREILEIIKELEIIKKDVFPEGITAETKERTESAIKNQTEPIERKAVTREQIEKAIALAELRLDLLFTPRIRVKVRCGQKSEHLNIPENSNLSTALLFLHGPEALDYPCGVTRNGTTLNDPQIPFQRGDVIAVKGATAPFPSVKRFDDTIQYLHDRILSPFEKSSRVGSGE